MLIVCVPLKFKFTETEAPAKNKVAAALMAAGSSSSAAALFSSNKLPAPKLPATCALSKPFVTVVPPLKVLAAARTTGLLALALATSKNCMACHAIDKKVVGPAYKDVAAKYAGQKDAADKLAEKIMTAARNLSRAIII